MLKNKTLQEKTWVILKSFHSACRKFFTQGTKLRCHKEKDRLKIFKFMKSICNSYVKLANLLNLPRTCINRPTESWEEDEQESLQKKKLKYPIHKKGTR